MQSDRRRGQSLRNLAVFEFQNGRSGEMHLPSGRRRQRSDEKITERRTALCATAFPTADTIIAFGNEIRSAPEMEVRKRFAEISHERVDICMALTRACREY